MYCCLKLVADVEQQVDFLLCHLGRAGPVVDPSRQRAGQESAQVESEQRDIFIRRGDAKIKQGFAEEEIIEE